MAGSARIWAAPKSRRSINKTRCLSPAHLNYSLAHGQPNPVPPARQHKNSPRAPAGDPAPPPDRSFPALSRHVIQAALRSTPQRFPACFQPSCLLLARMQVIAFRRGVRQLASTPPGLLPIQTRNYPPIRVTGGSKIVEIDMPMFVRGFSHNRAGNGHFQTYDWRL
jgi:hypothetical protein